ncbi:MAG: hypothetical protein V3T21_01315 [Candidatus Margulisiibacteriota bacterium]
MSLKAISSHRAQPLRHLSVRSPQTRIKRLEQALFKLALQYKLKPDKPPRHDRYIESQLERLEETKASDFFKVSPELVSTVVKQTRKLSGESTPIVLDIGGGSCSSHRRFAEAGLISVCIDPAAEVLEKAAQLQGMLKIAEGIWKDPKLDHYLVVGDAQIAAEIFGLDNKHPLLKPLTAQKQNTLARLISIGKDFDPDKIDSSLFLEALQDIAECEEKLRRFDQGDKAILVKDLEWAREGLISEKLEHYLELHESEIELLIDQLRSLDDLIEQKRLQALNSTKEPPLIDLVFSGYMPADINLTPEIKSILARGIIYIAEAGGATGIPTYEEVTKYRFFSEGFYNHSYLPGKSYEETVKEYFTERTKVSEGFWDRKENILIVQERKDLAPPPFTPIH